MFSVLDEFDLSFARAFPFQGTSPAETYERLKQTFKKVAKRDFATTQHQDLQRGDQNFAFFHLRPNGFPQGVTPDPLAIQCLAKILGPKASDREEGIQFVERFADHNARLDGILRIEPDGACRVNRISMGASRDKKTKEISFYCWFSFANCDPTSIEHAKLVQTTICESTAHEVLANGDPLSFKFDSDRLSIRTMSYTQLASAESNPEYPTDVRITGLKTLEEAAACFRRTCEQVGPFNRFQILVTTRFLDDQIAALGRLTAEIGEYSESWDYFRLGARYKRRYVPWEDETPLSQGVVHPVFATHEIVVDPPFTQTTVQKLLQIDWARTPSKGFFHLVSTYGPDVWDAVRRELPDLTVEVWDGRLPDNRWDIYQ